MINTIITMFIQSNIYTLSTVIYDDLGKKRKRSSQMCSGKSQILNPRIADFIQFHTILNSDAMQFKLSLFEIRKQCFDCKSHGWQDLFMQGAPMQRSFLSTYAKFFLFLIISDA